MPTVLQMSKQLSGPASILDIPGIRVRNYLGGLDIAPWLELRHRAFAGQRLGVRQWNEDDFAVEFLRKPWWRPDRMWLAFTEPEIATPPVLVGAVTLAMRGEHPHAIPAAHWLAVLPRWRRHGIARLLMAHLEAACWDDGQTEVLLETHAAWTAATQLYEALGYRRTSD